MENNLPNPYVIDQCLQNYEVKNNGRIPLKEGSHNGTFFMAQDCIAKDEKTNYNNATKYMHPPTLLSTLFFSAENIEIIQNAIRAKVYEMSKKKYKIDKQSYDQIKIIMRSIYLQYSKNFTHSIREQIETLNQYVLDYSVPRVYNELISYMKYRDDISTLPVPQDNPIHISIDRTVELKHFF
jgi:hypothetical protein